MQENSRESKVLVFIPAYNCEKQIPRVLRQFTNEILNWIDTVLIVNNRSTDHTEEAVLNEFQKRPREANAKFKLLRNTSNYGLGGSHKVAFQYAMDHQFTHVVVLHGDDQGDIQDFMPYLKSGEYLKFDCFLGARFHPRAKLQGYSLVRRLGNVVFNLLFSLGLKRMIYDLGSGLNCYNVSILRDGFYHRYPDNLTFNYCMIMGHIFYRHKMAFFPICWREDDQISNVKLFSQAKKVLAMLLHYVSGPQRFISSELRTQSIAAYTAEVIHDH